MANSVNSRCSEHKQNASQSKLSLLSTLEKRQKSDSNAGEEVESPNIACQVSSEKQKNNSFLLNPCTSKPNIHI